MKAWRLNEMDWYAADTFELAVTVAMNDTGMSREDVIDDMYVTGEPESDEKIIYSDETKRRKTTCAAIIETMKEPGYAFGKEW